MCALRFDRMSFVPAIFLLLVMPLSNCDPYDGEELTAVWSDDGARFGLLEREYRFPPSSIWNTRDYVRYRLLIEDPMTSKREAITGWIDGDPAEAPLYFMRRAGYFLLTDRKHSRVWRVALDGELRDLPQQIDPKDACEDFEAIPSPMGDQIATVLTRVVDCGSFPLPSRTQVEISFFDPMTMKRFGAPFQTVLTTIPRGTWTPQNEFLLVFTSSERCPRELCSRMCSLALHIAPGKSATWAIPPGCYEPPSTSGNACFGVELRVDEAGDIVMVPNEDAPSFGCQNDPPELPPCALLTEESPTSAAVQIR